MTQLEVSVNASRTSLVRDATAVHQDRLVLDQRVAQVSESEMIRNLVEIY